MSYEPLHHKYRPQSFKDLVGQETIAKTLSNAIAQTKIAPAYLFTGPRGTGKTSSARILAKSLNCLSSDKPTSNPCGRCEVCLAIATGTALDVMEIDAASNTGVDNIREIIERCRFAPVQCRYKVYAIDECHMLSTAAFNALLKTLEEPPPKVVFILATTDPQRVISTIISRCQRFDYRRIPLSAMVGHLKYIAKEENIAIADDALTLVAQIANGGLRDAESLLDQLSLLPEKITVEKVWDLVGAVPELDLLSLLKAIKRGRATEIIQQCRSLLDRGREPLVVLQNLASFYLNLLIAKTAPDRSEMVAVTESCWQELRTEAASWEIELILQGQQQLKAAEIQLKQTTQPRLWLEITLLGLLPAANELQSVTPTAVSKTIPSDRSYPTALAPNSSAPSGKDKLDVKQQERQEATSINGTEIKLEQERQAERAVKSDSKRDRNVVQLKPISSTSENEALESNSLNNLNQQTTRQNVQSEVETSDSVANEEIWERVIQCLQPPTTQALLRQQCHLISLEGSTAIVGIGSAKLQRLHQGKVTNIETAFAKVCQRIIKVKLEVANPRKPSVGNNVAAGSPAEPRSESRADLVSANQSETGDRPEESNTSDNPAALQTPDNTIANAPVESPPPIVPETASTSLEPNSSQPLQATEVESNSLATTDDTENIDDLQRAIANLTRSFEGELVELDDYSIKKPEFPLTANCKEPDAIESPTELKKNSHLTSPSFSSSTKIKIKRQDIEDMYDEEDEDVPFRRPVYSKTNFETQLFDSWELEANRYWDGIKQLVRINRMVD
ncbi:DNA polymerase III subunit gamma/tau [Myxosarcina sp. GI1(2024)]